MSAYNSIGWNTASSPNTAGATIQTEPVQMSSPTRGSSTSQTQIEVSWTALSSASDTRGSSITTYHLQWDAGSNGGTWSDLIGLTSNYVSTTFYVTSGLTAGTSYQFKVRAKNAYGYGDYSSPTTIVASDKPGQMSTVTTAVYSDTYVRISWAKPSENSDTIT